MRPLRMLISVLAVTTVSLTLWHSRAGAEPIDHYRPPVLTKAERALQWGNPDRALALLEGSADTLRRAPHRAEVSALQCRAHYELGDYAAAEAACDTAVEIGGEVQTWSHLNNRGVMRLLLGRVDDAIRDFEAAESLNPVAWSVYRNLAAARGAQSEGAITVSSLR